MSFTGAVADDTQKIVIANNANVSVETTTSTTETTTVEVTPKYDGENLGTIPIVEEGTYGFKTTYSIDSDKQGFCFGNNYKTYTLKLKLNNIGSAMCETSMYTVTCNDSKLTFVSGDKRGNFSSIEAGNSKELTFTVKYGEVNTEYVDVPINISITDSKYMRTWEDSVTLRFYKGLVKFFVGSRNFDSSSSANLKGFLIYPDGRSKGFYVSGGHKKTILVPWSESDYMLSFSGATASNEMAYSFGFEDKTSLAELYEDVWTPEEINAYEPNDSTATAYKITDLTTPIKSYLKAGDIDFYTINCSTCDSTVSVSYDIEDSQDYIFELSLDSNPFYDKSVGKIYFYYSPGFHDGQAYIWINGSYSGESFTYENLYYSGTRRVSVNVSGTGTYSIVLKNGDTSSAIRISKTISVTVE